MHQAIAQYIDTTYGPGDCHGWTGPTSDIGYPMVNFQGQRLGARRLIREIVKGDLAKGRSVRMSCGNVGCVNPEHMS